MMDVLINSMLTANNYIVYLNDLIIYLSVIPQ